MKAVFNEYQFDKNVPHNMTKQKLDFSRIKNKKNLIRITKISPLITSENYIGDFKISRILYDGDKAAVIFVKKGNTTKGSDGSRHILFFKQEYSKWKFYKGKGIPFKYYDEEIVL